MFALLQIAALCAAADASPNYTVHVRELTAPEKVIRVRGSGSIAVRDAVEALKRSPRDIERMELWIVRQSANGNTKVLPIDWTAISQKGACATNYIVLSGDRLILQARPQRK